MGELVQTLPVEVLEEIFSYLDTESLEQASETLKTWNDVIYTARKTRNRLTFAVTKDNVNVLSNFDREALQTDPKMWKFLSQIYWITLEMIRSDVPGLQEFIEANSEFIRRITFDKMVRYLQPVLDQVPLLETLEITNCIFDFTNLRPIFLDNLKCLKINNYCIEKEDMLRHIQNTDNLNEFSIKDLRNGDRIKNINQFLRYCPALKKLTIWIEPEKKLVQSDLFGPEGLSKNLPFRLKYLNMRNFHSLSNERRISEFLELHEKTLEHLDIQKQQNLIDPSLSQQILSCFAALKTLKVNARCLPDGKNFYMALDPLPNVTDLTVLGEIAKHQDGKYFYALFPSLEKLTVDPHLSYFPKFLTTLNRSHPNLQYLSYSYFRPGTPCTLEFKNLKYLAVKDIKSKAVFMNFVLTHRNLRSVSIGDITEVTNEDLSEILQLPALRNLELTAMSKADIKRAFDFIKQDYKGLQSAKFSYKIPSALDYLHQTILFPFEKHFWNSQKYENFFKIETEQ